MYINPRLEPNLTECIWEVLVASYNKGDSLSTALTAYGFSGGTPVIQKNVAFAAFKAPDASEIAGVLGVIAALRMIPLGSTCCITVLDSRSVRAIHEETLPFFLKTLFKMLTKNKFVEIISADTKTPRFDLLQAAAYHSLEYARPYKDIIKELST